MPSRRPLSVHGGLVHTPRLGEWELLPEALVCVDDSGTITSVRTPNQPGWHAALSGCPGYLRLPPGQFLVPGLVDCHIHAPQFAYAGNGLDLPLMEWLQQYTFPSEAQMADTGRADAVYRACVQRTLQMGTTTACYFGTIHPGSCLRLGRAALDAGQRALVGLVSMDINAPEEYSRSPGRCVEELERFVAAIEQMDPTGSMVLPVVTPRFVPTCSLELLGKLGGFVRAHRGIRVQSHIAESLDCVAAVRQAHPGHCAGREAGILDQAGLLTGTGVMAHGVHLSPAEVALMADRGTAVAHCPLSNAYFAHGVLRVRQLLSAGVKVGLGTDVAGGYSPSMLSAIRSAVVSSRMLQDGVDCYDFGDSGQQSEPREPRQPAALGMKEALWLATVGGAQACGLAGLVGSFEPGKQFDALVVDPSVGLDLFGGVKPSKVGLMESSVEQWLHNGDDRNIVAVYVDGQQRYASENHKSSRL